MPPGIDTPPPFNETVEGWVMVASLTVLAYDYLCTLKQEVDYVWSSPWFILLPLFYLNRYLPFVDQTILLHLEVSVNTREACLIQNTLAIWILNLGSTISQTIIILRTVGIWGWKSRVGYALYAIAFCTWVITISFIGVEVASIEYSPLDFPSRGCPIRRVNEKFIGVTITIFLVEILIVTLTAIKAFSHVRQSHSSWVRQVYRDGLFFCGCMLFITLFNIVAPRLSIVPPMYKGISSIPQRVLHSIFCNRVMLQILEIRAPPGSNNRGSRSRSTDGAPMFTTIQPVSFCPPDEVELSSPSMLEREECIG